MGTFEARMRELSDQVGQGTIEAQVKVSQLYAQRQHQGAHFNHPRGGEAFYLKNALMANYREHYQRVAMELYRGNVQALFIRFGERVASDSSKRTPVELGNLKESDSVKVKVQGRVIYSRPARKPKMSRTQLNRRIRLHHIERAARRAGGD